MDSVFIIIVVLMFVLAITDLIVGVSNDAVNFLNSAIGSNAGSFKKIMIIASLGILFGSVFSSGMMEVARKGVFNPQFFSFEMIMYLFAAVMLTDIILLDFYNSIALPTSTTVSIVFELLGSAIAVSFFAVLKSGDSITKWGEHINGDRALIIIAGIFLSVVLAFVLGWMVQYVTRLIVSFNYNKTMRSFGSVFGAASVALIVVFIVLKGLKGVPFLEPEVLSIIKSNVGLISLITFVLAFIVFQIFIGRKGFSVYRFITLLGTFALAMAFASNDLVNFVGVPIASFDAYMNWKDSGVEANRFMMEALAEPVQTNPLFLIASGVIMILTLWFSKKARSVVQTSLNLGRQDEGAERFDANGISRGLVMAVSKMANTMASVLPLSTRFKMAARFTEHVPDIEIQKDQVPAFDLVRASVNLIVAAGIILVATSYKLPLSTTFVTFMVLMGTSLADQAWGQGSAVYRVAGVLTVVGGWLLTAIIAMTVSMVFASLLVWFKTWALGALIILAFLLIFKKFIFSRNQKFKPDVNLEMEDEWFKLPFEDIDSEVRKKLALILNRFNQRYGETLQALVDNNSSELSRLKALIKEVETINNLYKVKITHQIKSIPEATGDGGKILMYIYDLENDLLYSLSNIIRISHRHVANLHPIVEAEQRQTLLENKKELHAFSEMMENGLLQDHISKNDYGSFKSSRKSLIKQIERGISDQILLASSKKLSGRNSELVLNILLSSKNIVFYCSRLVKLFYKINSGDASDMLEKMLEE